jgi:hypothetical protein
VAQHSAELSRLEAALAALAETVRANALADEQRRAQEEQRRTQEEQRRAEHEQRFAQEMRERDRRMDAESRAFNRKLGEISHKQGVFVQEMAAPSVPRVIREVFGLPDAAPLSRDVYALRRLRDGREQEVDVIATFLDHVCFVSVKSTLRTEHVDAFIASIPTLRPFFPEHEGRIAVGALAALHLPDNAARYAERKGLIVMGMGTHLMECRNRPGFRPRPLG